MLIIILFNYPLKTTQQLKFIKIRTTSSINNKVWCSNSHTNIILYTKLKQKLKLMCSSFLYISTINLHYEHLKKLFNKCMIINYSQLVNKRDVTDCKFRFFPDCHEAYLRYHNYEFQKLFSHHDYKPLYPKHLFLVGYPRNTYFWLDLDNLKFHRTLRKSPTMSHCWLCDDTENKVQRP